jgi:hypothetical protein
MIPVAAHFAEIPLVTRILSKRGIDLNKKVVLQQTHLTAQEELSSTKSWWVYKRVDLSG